MNRQQFLAELNQYLTFFSPEERAKILSDYTGKFEAAGEASEAALLLEFGTPMIVAIELKRRKESGEKFADMSEESYWYIFGRKRFNEEERAHLEKLYN